jgi:hypothetical protein
MLLLSQAAEHSDMASYGFVLAIPVVVLAGISFTVFRLQTFMPQHADDVAVGNVFIVREEHHWFLKSRHRNAGALCTAPRS